MLYKMKKLKNFCENDNFSGDDAIFEELDANITESEVQACIKKKVQVGKDQEKAQSEKDSHSKNRGGKKPN